MVENAIPSVLGDRRFDIPPRVASTIGVYGRSVSDVRPVAR